jgi:hypothetical protein
MAALNISGESGVASAEMKIMASWHRQAKAALGGYWRKRLAQWHQRLAKEVASAMAAKSSNISKNGLEMAILEAT